MKGKNYKIVSLYSFFPFQENLILDLKNKLLEIENENDLSGLLIFASEGINGTICAEKNVIDIVINLIKKYTDHEFMVYEREESLSLEEGYGIQLATNSIKILNQIESQKHMTFV